MTNVQKISLFLLRISLGGLFLYAGVTKLLDPAWSSVGYLNSAKAFQGLYTAFASPSVLPFIDFINEWGLTLLGVSLILGAGVKLSGKLGALLMLLYYLPLGFPYPNAHALIVDEHVVYMFALVYLSATTAGHAWSLGGWFAQMPVLSKFRSWLT